MNKTILYIILIVGLLGCQHNNDAKGQLFKGELFIKLVGVGFEIVEVKGEDGMSIIDRINEKSQSELS